MIILYKLERWNLICFPRRPDSYITWLLLQCFPHRHFCIPKFFSRGRCYIVMIWYMDYIFLGEGIPPLPPSLSLSLGPSGRVSLHSAGLWTLIVSRNNKKGHTAREGRGGGGGARWVIAPSRLARDPSERKQKNNTRARGRRRKRGGGGGFQRASVYIREHTFFTHTHTHTHTHSHTHVCIHTHTHISMQRRGPLLANNETTKFSLWPGWPCRYFADLANCLRGPIWTLANCVIDLLNRKGQHSSRWSLSEI